MMRPWSKTRMRSALRIVASRCAMTKVVRPFITSSSASWSLRSVAASSALVASSRIRIGGFLRSARAIERRWRSPPESERPRSPIDGVEAVGLAGDEFERLRALERLDHLLVGGVRAADLEVLADRAREQHRLLEHDADVAPERRQRQMSRMSSPSMRIAPDCGSKARCRSPSVVDLPEPVAPTSATVSPGRTANETSCTAGRLPS